MDYITEHISDADLSVEAISREIGMSRVHFYRKIKALTNYTPVEFIRTVRLNRAAQLLREKAYSISEIRYMVGIQDADYFRKCFKTQFGVTPSDFVENMA